ncbi:hypothetical protein OUZ56_019893 [Daphnia magna]|uniref:Uncharacterized protein n=1 Tax=Daphnia magna TaxID=35525 RepID=A0ABQ9ZCY0_9CRUS|nr:hypothetical protein OUZ56_019893 [Daphnia magna]
MSSKERRANMSRTGIHNLIDSMQFKNRRAINMTRALFFIRHSSALLFDVFLIIRSNIFGFRFPKRRDRNQGGAGWVDIARQELDKVKKAEAIGLGLVDR